jgi:Large polyvalent protein associated domain 29
MTTTYTATQTAKFVRQALKSAFPHQKFSVTSSRHSIDIKWFDGVSKQEVATVTNKFGGMEFDGMSDCDRYSKTIINGEEAQCYCYKPNLQHQFSHEFAVKVMVKALKVSRVKPSLVL